ncbi:MAG: acyltransferase family protein [Planctomycetes bacterium]|nr:acyltransferase family protein [Planctomycetota bacterium]
MMSRTEVARCVIAGASRSASPSDPRRHDLDALRAFAMLLGIGLHAALSFMDIPWVVHDRVRAPEFGYVVSAIHGFRMPLFFLLSGFFTAMLWRKRGLGGLLRHRAKRIALPLGLGCATIVPAMWVIVIWAGSGNSTYGTGEVDTGRDIWTAAVYGDLDAVRRHVESGAALDAAEPIYGQSPLAWAVIGDQLDVIEYLLEAGADPSARYRDRNTALHTAAFFGRAEAADRLLDAGAEFNARNDSLETPLDSMRHGQGTTEYIAGLLQLPPVDFDAVVAGRGGIRTMLEDRGAISGLANPWASSGAEAGDGQGSEAGPLRVILEAVLRALMLFPFFHHLWFLWHLCWLVVGFALVVVVFRWLPRVPIPSILIATPLCLFWVVPMTMLTQSIMHEGGTMPGFGPDTSAGLVPRPHVLAHYAIFFGFGALMFGSPGAAERLGRRWWIQLPLALLLLPVALALALHSPWGRELAGDEDARRMLANLGQVLYVWLMIFGLMGLFETVLNRERPWVRYGSDSSYWLYLVHLPLIIVGQALLRDVDLPAIVKLAVLIAVATSILLASYQFLVRYTWIGRLLNGSRARSRVTP